MDFSVPAARPRMPGALCHGAADSPPSRPRRVRLFTPGELRAPCAGRIQRGEAQHGVESATSNLEQLVLRCFTRGPRGVDNTAAAVHDLHIAVAAHTPREFLLAVSAEDEVRVRIDEARQQGLARGVDDGIARFVHRQRFARVKHV